MRRSVRRLSVVAVVCLTWGALACGETRRSLGEECIRDEDCLSGICASRACVSAPARVTGGSNPPPDETPKIPDPPDAALADAPEDAREGG